LALSADTAALRRQAVDGATDDELVAIYCVPMAEFVATYGALLAKARADLAGRVRRAMLAAADKGEPVALTYLAETYLSPPAERRADRPRLLERIRRAMMGRAPRPM
jgi:hypothetical protein